MSVDGVSRITRADDARSRACSQDEVHEPEVELTGGCLTPGVVRVGNTVRRPSKPSSSFVATLLGRLESHGVTWAPRYLGLDEAGRDVLTYVHGSVPQVWRRFDDRQIHDAARLLREFHDATRGSECAQGGDVVCHHDPGPHNFVFDEDRPIAIIDFDMAAPGDPLEDLGYMAWAWCISSKPDRQPFSAQAQQVLGLVDAYGLDRDSRLVVVAATIERLSRNIGFWTDMLASRDAIPTSPDEIRERIVWSEHERAYIIANREPFTDAVR